MPAYFVTATGTDIGKTYVTAGLVRLLRARGEAVSALKPIASGVSPAQPAASDPGVLLAALGRPADAIDSICPWHFEAPLSPDMAAAREGREIDFEALLEYCCSRMAEAQGPLFIEGVGGVMVPLDARHTVLDWMTDLRIPLIVVAGSYLGTISHTLTALDVVQRASLRVAAVVVNESAESPVPPAETVCVLERFVPGISVSALSRTQSPAESGPEFARLWEALTRG